MEWWELFVVLFVMLPLMALWIGCIIDMISRPDLKAITKGIWVVVVLFFPFFGALAYIIMRPQVVVSQPGNPDAAWGQNPADFPTSQTTAGNMLP